MTGLVGAKPPAWTEGDWLSWRRDGIGGSDVAALCGLSRFASPMSVFVDKCQLGAPRDVGEAAQWGNILEDPIAREFEAREGLFVLHSQALAVDTAAPWRRCTLDGLIAESPELPLDDLSAFLGTCQIKCSADFGWDEFPDEYTVQIQYEMGVTGLERAWVPVLHRGNRLAIYGPFDADQRAFDALCSIADRFWHEHVQAQSPPPSDGSPATTEALKAAFSSGGDDPVELPAEIVDLAKSWPAAKARAKAAEAEVDRIENALRLALSDHPVAGIRDTTGELVPLVTWKPQSAGARIDTKRLKAELPDIARAFTPEAGTTRVLRHTKQLLELAGAEDQTEGAHT